MSTERLKRNLSTLGVLLKAPKWQREALIVSANRDLLTCFYECASDVLYKKVPLTDV